MKLVVTDVTIPTITRNNRNLSDTVFSVIRNKEIIEVAFDRYSLTDLHGLVSLPAYLHARTFCDIKKKDSLRNLF